MADELSESIGLCVLMHNEAEYAEACLDSISQQWGGPWRDVTILVSGSTDGTDNLVRQWIDSLNSTERPVLEVLSENLGPMGGLVHLLRSIGTTYAAILHGDDLLLNGYYESLMSAKPLLGRQSILVSDMTVLAEVKPAQWNETGRLTRSLVLRSKLWNRFALNVYNIAGIGGAILPVEFCLDLLAKERLPTLLCAEDWFLFSLVTSAGGEIRRSPNAVYGYRLHGRNTTKSPLQTYSVGYVRGVLNRQRHPLLRGVSRLQTARERRTFAATSEYDRGLLDGLGRERGLSLKTRSHFNWLAVPFLLTLNTTSCLSQLGSRMGARVRWAKDAIRK